MNLAKPYSGRYSMNLAKPHSWPSFLLPPSLPLPSPSRRRPQPRPSRARRELRGEATQSASSPKGSRAHQAIVPAGVLGTAPLPPPANDVAMFASPLPPSLSPTLYFSGNDPSSLACSSLAPLLPGPLRARRGLRGRGGGRTQCPRTGTPAPSTTGAAAACHHGPPYGTSPHPKGSRARGPT